MSTRALRKAEPATPEKNEAFDRVIAYDPERDDVEVLVSALRAFHASMSHLPPLTNAFLDRVKREGLA